MGLRTPSFGARIPAAPVIGRIARPSAVDVANVSGARVSPRHSLRARRECAWRRSEDAGQMATHGIGGLGYSLAQREWPGGQYDARV